jgi:uncharacterized protein (TIGR02996 family)
MSEREALFRAILEGPDDDAVRLVFADWLDENGDEADRKRAELIRLQCELANLPDDDPRYAELEARERRLVAEHAGAWLGPLAGKLPGWRFQRGFVESLGLSLERLRALPSEVFDLVPVRSLEVYMGSFDEAGAAWLAGHPGLARLHRLRLSGDLGGMVPASRIDRAIRPVAESPYLGRLRTFELSHLPVEDETVSLFLRSPALAQLQALRLDHTACGDGTVTALTALPCAHLRRLHLTDNHSLSAAGVGALVASPLCLRLSELDLGGSQTSANWRTGVDEALAAVAAVLPGSSLTALRVSGPPVRPLLTGLAAAPSWGRLEALAVSESGLSGEALQAFLACPHLAGLRRLSLVYCELGPDDARALAACPHLAGLRRLQLWGNRQLGDEGVSALLRSPYLTRLTHLGLDRTGLTLVGLEALAQSPNVQHLRWLDPEAMAPGAGQVLAASPYLQRLTTLVGFGGPITDDDIVALVGSPNLPALTALFVSLDGLSARGVQALLEAGHLAWLYLRIEDMKTPGQRELWATRFRALEGNNQIAWEV